MEYRRQRQMGIRASLIGKLWDRLGERTRAVLQPLLVLGALILCTASLVDAGYNPFLYFRF